eukprot:scaffold11232_cov100-Isochrysis_galbana.AAC.4
MGGGGPCAKRKGKGAARVQNEKGKGRPTFKKEKGSGGPLATRIPRGGARSARCRLHHTHVSL